MNFKNGFEQSAVRWFFVALCLLVSSPGVTQSLTRTWLMERTETLNENNHMAISADGQYIAVIRQSDGYFRTSLYDKSNALLWEIRYAESDDPAGISRTARAVAVSPLGVYVIYTEQLSPGGTAFAYVAKYNIPRGAPGNGIWVAGHRIPKFSCLCPMEG